MYKIIIFGCGQVYNSHLLHLRQMEAKGEAEIVGVYSKDLYYGKTLDGYRILSKEEISSVEHDYLLVMAEKKEKEIIQKCLLLGERKEKILPSRILDIPNLSFSQYVDIKKKRFSILSETSYAGILYNTLGLEVLSPFKNLWLHREDYLRILENLPYYMSLSPTFLKPFDGVPGPYDQSGYPILCLDKNILLYCNHYSDPETAISKWNERRNKINYQSILATFYAEDRDWEKKFYNVPLNGKRLCFTPYRSDNPDTVYIPKEGGEYTFTELHRSAKPYNTLADIYSLFFGPVTYRRK